MVALKPIFPGKDNSDLLYLIMKARGTTPSVEDLEHLNPELCGNEALLCGVKLERAPRRALWWVLGRDLGYLVVTMMTRLRNGL